MFRDIPYKEFSLKFQTIYKLRINGNTFFLNLRDVYLFYFHLQTNQSIQKPPARFMIFIKRFSGHFGSQDLNRHRILTHDQIVKFLLSHFA